MDWCAGIGLADRDVQVREHRLRVHVGGAGRPVVLLHGNPTHAFLWRRVIPALLPYFRCLAVDLAGFGASSEQHDLGVAEHARLVAAAVRELVHARERLVWLAHDWGVAVALNAVAELAEQARHSVAMTEGHVRWIPSWESADPGFADLFGRLRGESFGQRFAVRDNAFVEQILLGSLPGLGPGDQAEYRAPFERAGRRRAILRLAREVPVGGEPPDMVVVLRVVEEVLADPRVPTLLLHGDPGAVVDDACRRWIVDRAAGLTEVGIGPAGHFTPEEQPAAIAAAVIAWLEDDAVHPPG